jgi:hypothetical protein
VRVANGWSAALRGSARLTGKSISGDPRFRRNQELKMTPASRSRAEPTAAAGDP